MRYLGSPSKLVYILSKNAEDKVRTIFGFNLYATSLQIALVVFFRRKLSKLRRLGLLKGSKACHC